MFPADPAFVSVTAFGVAAYGVRVAATGRRLQVSAESGQSKAARLANEIRATRAPGYRSRRAATSARAVVIRDAPSGPSRTAMSGDRSTRTNRLGACGSATRVRG